MSDTEYAYETTFPAKVNFDDDGVSVVLEVQGEAMQIGPSKYNKPTKPKQK